MAGCLMTGAALAGGTGGDSFQGFTKVLYDRTQIDVRADGTATETREWATKVLTEQGVSSANEAEVSYSQELQNADILEAYTIKADGRRIDAPKSNYQRSSETGSDGASPMFSDLQSESVVFPEVGVGDTVVFKYRIVDREALFPGQFSFARSFSKFSVEDEVSIRLSAPSSMKMNVLARGVDGGAVEAAAGQNRWEWHYHNAEMTRPERGAVSSFDYGPLVVATTFKDYGDIAAAYESRARPKETVTPPIHALAAQLTHGITEPREQVRALYDWVSKNIKFAGNCVGSGSVVPHEADRVLANRMGDCKDHVALMQALMSDLGIHSTPALINARDVYKLPGVPTMEVFNHVINYVPSLDLFVDATAEDVLFGELPNSEYGKPVLLTADYQGIRYTPKRDNRNDRTVMSTQIEFAADGSAVAMVNVDVQGSWAASVRDSFGYISPNMEDLSVRRMLTGNGFIGVGTLIRPDPKGPPDHARHGGEFHLSEVLDLPGPGAWPISSPYGSGISVGSMRAILNEAPRTVDFECSAWGYRRDEFTLKLPPGSKLLAVPRDRSVKAKWASYQSHYTSEGNVLTVVRDLQDNTPGPVCSPQDAEALKPFAAEVLKDLRAPLMYQ